MAQFDFENEGVRLAEHAAQWSKDWADFAELAEKALRLAYIHGLKDAAEIVLRTEGVDSARIRDRIAEVERQRA
jgi:hypothetical protein